MSTVLRCHGSPIWQVCYFLKSPPKLYNNNNNDDDDKDVKSQPLQNYTMEQKDKHLHWKLISVYLLWLAKLVTE